MSKFPGLACNLTMFAHAQETSNVRSRESSSSGGGLIIVTKIARWARSGRGSSKDRELPGPSGSGAAEGEPKSSSGGFFVASKLARWARTGRASSKDKEVPSTSQQDSAPEPSEGEAKPTTSSTGGGLFVINRVARWARSGRSSSKEKEVPPPTTTTQLEPVPETSEGQEKPSTSSGGGLSIINKFARWTKKGKQPPPPPPPEPEPEPEPEPSKGAQASVMPNIFIAAKLAKMAKNKAAQRTQEEETEENAEGDQPEAAANLFVASRLAKVAQGKGGKRKGAAPATKGGFRAKAGAAKTPDAMANILAASKMAKAGKDKGDSKLSKPSTPTPRPDSSSGDAKTPEQAANLLVASRMAKAAALKKSEVKKSSAATPEPDPENEASEGVGFVLTVPAPGPLDMSTLAAPPPPRGPGSAKSSKSIKSISSVKSVEYGTQDYSAPKPDPSPRFPCCPMITLPPLMHSTVRLCCPQNYKIGQHPTNPMIGKFGIPQSPPYKEEKKPTGCQANLVTCLTAIGCRDEKRDRWWWNVCIKKKRKKGVAPVSVIGGPMTLANKPSWAKAEEEGPERPSAFTRFFKRTCCKCCFKEEDVEKGLKKQGCCGRCGSSCYSCFKKWFGPCYCGCCDKWLCICCKKAADEAAETTAAAAAMDAVSKWGAAGDGKGDKKRGSMDPVTEKPKLDPSLVEHNSLIRAAIPILPIPLAWLCLLANAFMPGSGTLSSGIFCLCLGKARFSIYDRPEGRLGSFCLNIIVAIFQVFTVIFCLVGWGWSLWWGVIMVRIARKHKKLRLRALEETSGSQTASSNKDENS